MLPKSIYEALPFCYFVIGSALWLIGDNPPTIAAGVLLYWASAQQWVLRTHYRRHDRLTANLISKGRGRQIEDQNKRLLPRQVYELTPFIYIAVGYLICNLTRFASPYENGYQLDLTLFSAFLFFLSGMLVLLLRGVHRLVKEPVPIRA